MSASKQRTEWSQLPRSTRARIERLAAGRVVAAYSRLGGFSPGFASRLRLADGRRLFVKAIDTAAWPDEAVPYRAEARITAGLPAAVPAPRLLGYVDDGDWVVLGFEDIDGHEPTHPWRRGELDLVLAALDRMSQALTPSPIALPAEHPRLGGWAELAGDRTRLARLAAHTPWAANQLLQLIRLERRGLEAARGESLVHFDLYPHNILLTADRVVFVDWPHARLGAIFVDLVMVLSSAAADGIDPDPILRHHPLATGLDPPTIDAVLAAHAGFLFATGLAPHARALQPIADAKIKLGYGSLDWLQRRLGNR